MEDINLDIHEGEVFGIIGFSGAAKYLVSLHELLERPTKGTVFLMERTLSKLSKKELLIARQSMGMIFQHFNLLMQRNSLDNVCFPLEIVGMDKSQAQKRACMALEIVGLSDRLGLSLPTVGRSEAEIGNCQGPTTRPKVLLCDEATSALDPATTHSILGLLKQINKDLGLTIVVITHEMSVIEEICQRIAIIDNSRIVEIGNR